MSDERDWLAMQNCLCFNLRRTSRAVTQYYENELRRHGLRPTQTPILSLLAAKPELGMAEVSEWLGMDRTTLVRNLRPLQREGLVEMTGAGRGKRVALSITPAGRAALAKLLPDWRVAQSRAVAVLGPERWATLLGDLERVAARLQD